ncbi:MAG: peptidoglycan DD-metalloendopeptidase family protein [Thiobacillus sp.]|uniref:peptidoglycan DD-metalloendopeptidase family protein n=1 Tax=Thiobacillus sp. TaxID=924 RepID=UPI0028941519|nr:peptidoglycan DD-metalloendopeptidase family protein [Thiobacillus sp.]MDT3707650.1 peptidoglycan DD-metalloendopeptidase family protein [Thiobacillus sp.]
MRNAWLVVMLLGLAACTARGPAPVTERSPARVGTVQVAAKAETPRVTPQIAPSTNGMHTVQRGDTLYGIAFANSLDYREIAGWNQLESPDQIMVGQVLRLTPPPGAVEIMPLDDDALPSARALDGSQLDERPLGERPLVEPLVLREPQAVLLPYSGADWAKLSATPAVAARSAPEPAPAAPAATPATPAVASAPAVPAAKPVVGNGGWLWPADGTLLGRFGAAGGKGIDIVGQRNTPVKAVAPGKVVYSGSGLRGYGRLLIVKHAGEYLSAYAHNESILVKEGDTVAAGQRIALMGDSDADRVKLHFEIRRYGKPLDPLNYLPERS